MIKSKEFLEQDILEKNYWYFGNHSKDFVKMCYAVELLSKIPEGASQSELDQARDEFNRLHPYIQVQTSMYKSMIASKIYGLLDSSHSEYSKCKPTPVFQYIRELTGGNFLETHLYFYVIEQQVEKIYYSSPFLGKGHRKEFQLYPLFLLYKVLLEIGRKTGEYGISNVEFDCFVATAREYKEWPSVVETILYYRGTGSLDSIISDIVKKTPQGKIDQRYFHFIKALPQFVLARGQCSLRQSDIRSISDKVAAFEFVYKIKAGNPGSLPNGCLDFHNYSKFLGKNIPLLPRL